jgi:hypothetical protein
MVLIALFDHRGRETVDDRDSDYYMDGMSLREVSDSKIERDLSKKQAKQRKIIKFVTTNKIHHCFPIYLLLYRNEMVT